MPRRLDPAGLRCLFRRRSWRSLLLGIAVALALGALAPMSPPLLCCGVLPVSVRFGDLPGAAGPGGAVRAVDDAGLLALAARRDRPGSGRRAVPRHRRSGAAPDPCRYARRDGGSGARARSSRGRYRAGPDGRAVVRRRGDRRLRALPGGGGGDPLGREAARPAAPPGAAPGARQSAPPGRADRAGRAVARDRAHRAGRRRAGRGQSRPRGRDQRAGRGARPSSSSTSSPTSSPASPRSCAPPPARASIRCRCCAAASPG